MIDIFLHNKNIIKKKNMYDIYIYIYIYIYICFLNSYKNLFLFITSTFMNAFIVQFICFFFINQIYRYIL